MMNRAYFFRHIVNLQELRTETQKSLANKERTSKFCIRESVILRDEEFEHFSEHFMKTHDFITPHRAFLDVNESCEYVCISVSSLSADFEVLVNTSGYSYARNVAIIHKGVQVD